MNFFFDDGFCFFYFGSSHFDVLTHLLLHVSDVVELDVGEFAEARIDVAREGEVDGEQTFLLRDVFLADDEMRG